MKIYEILLIAIGLAMDCFAVSISGGLTIKDLRFTKALKPSFFFATFQILMPIAGWFIGGLFSRWFSQVDHFIAFFILTFIGCKMIYEALKKEESKKTIRMDNLKVLLGLSVATSIDALIVGFGLGFIGFPVVTFLISVWSVTFSMSMTGLFIAKRVGPLFGKRAEVMGGVLLCLIGLKILLEHLEVIRF